MLPVTKLVLLEMVDDTGVDLGDWSYFDLDWSMQAVLVSMMTGGDNLPNVLTRLC